MRDSRWPLLALACLFLGLCCISAEASTYVGSVVEMAPVNFRAGQYERMFEQLYQEALLQVGPVNADEAHVLAVKLLNLKRYEHAISLVANETDIIVFNEDGITGWPLGYDEGRDGALPWLEEIPALGSIPCEDGSVEPTTSPSVFYASQYARDYRLTVVIDLGEVEWCDGDSVDGCPSDGRWQYNSQLVFNDDGSLLARHRKLHLFLADANIFNYPLPSLDHFESSFGVRFGMLVCFDVWFRYPGFAMAEGELELENFILSSWWENNGTLPLVSAANMQQSFARSADVNLLACSVGVSFFNSGSGVYNGPNKQQNYVYNVDFPSLDMHIVSMELPVSPRSQAIDNPWKRTITVPLDVAKTSVKTQESPLMPIRRKPSSLISMPQNANVLEVTVRPGDPPHEATLTMGSLSCSFNYRAANATNSEEGLFAMMAYQGPYFDEQLYADVCALYKCNEEFGCSALTLNAGGIAFEAISISATFNSRQPPYGITSGHQGQLFDMDAFMTTSFSGGVRLVSQESFRDPIVNIVLYAEQAGHVSP